MNFESSKDKINSVFYEIEKLFLEYHQNISERESSIKTIE